MKIVDEALNPFWIKSDYNGLSLWEPFQKDGKKLMEVPVQELPTLINEVVKRKLSSMEGEVTLAEFAFRFQSLQTMMQDAVNLKIKPQQEKPAMAKEVIS